MIKISHRGRMDSFLVMDTLAKANEMQRQGKTVYRFEAGQPAFSVPAPAAAAAAEFAKSPNVGYTDPMGLPALRTAISDHYKSIYGADIDISRIVITPGASGAFSLAFLSCFEVGDRVAMSMPCYPSYKRILESFGVEVVPILATAEDKYHPTPDLLEQVIKGDKIDGLVIASPGNPTGTTLTPQELADLINFCKHRGIRVISDELYHGIEFDHTQSTTACQIDENALVINSFSKYFCMTGWRLGWMIVPENMITVTNNLQSNVFICASAISQQAGIKVFECKDALNANLDRYRINRDVFVKRMTDMGIDKFSYPNGGFYFYADIAHLTDDSVAFANALLEQAHVSTSPGLDFDPYRGHTTIRFSYVCDTDHANAGLDALEKFIKRQV